MATPEQTSVLLPLRRRGQEDPWARTVQPWADPPESHPDVIPGEVRGAPAQDAYNQPGERAEPQLRLWANGVAIPSEGDSILRVKDVKREQMSDNSTMLLYFTFFMPKIFFGV